VQALAFSFTKLVVSDLERSERFYCDSFGMTVTRRVTSTDHEFALTEAILSLPGGSGSHVLVLTRYLSRAAPPPGAAWTGFVVSDIAGTMVMIEKAGGRVAVATHDSPDHKFLAALVADPEGHMIELIQLR
jgi:lactoylglutathione lyase